MNIIQHMFIAQCCYDVDTEYLQLNMTRGDIKILSRLLRLTSLYLLIFPKPVRYKTRQYLFLNFSSNKNEKFKWNSLFYPQNLWPDFQDLDTTHWSKGDADCCKKLVTSSRPGLFKCTERNMCWDGNCKKLKFRI